VNELLHYLALLGIIGGILALAIGAILLSFYYSFAGILNKHVIAIMAVFGLGIFISMGVITKTETTLQQQIVAENRPFLEQVERAQKQYYQSQKGASQFTDQLDKLVYLDSSLIELREHLELYLAPDKQAVEILYADSVGLVNKTSRVTVRAPN